MPGRFVDLLELDAASNTGVDNMRDILDNARYAPTVGRYKVYLIDEVHMLSKSAFNSMLKTLEEPPEHVKFVLATTDPQKIPVTVLSRCLQFNLKQLPQPQIAARLEFIVAAEKIAADGDAIALIARAAAGSMRDALSLLDQAIAHGNGEVRDAAVRAMLGAVDKEYTYRIAAAVAAGDGKALLAEIDAMTERSIDFELALAEQASLYHRVAVAQTVPAAASAFDDAERIAGLASGMTPEAVQLAYQICVQGSADLSLAPDAATGFSMALLRLLAFQPGGATGGVDGDRPPIDSHRLEDGDEVQIGKYSLTFLCGGDHGDRAADHRPQRSATGWPAWKVDDDRSGLQGASNRVPGHLDLEDPLPRGSEAAFAAAHAGGLPALHPRRRGAAAHDPETAARRVPAAACHPPGARVRPCGG